MMIMGMVIKYYELVGIRFHRTYGVDTLSPGYNLLTETLYFRRL